MTNINTVCLFFGFIFLPSVVPNVLPDACSKGPTYWCKSLRSAADCNAVQHCIQTVWETQNVEPNQNEISDKFVRLFALLKGMNTKINQDYIIPRIQSECMELPADKAIEMCQNNVENLGPHLKSLVDSKASPSSMCRAIGMCDNEDLDYAIFENKMKNHIYTKKPYLVGNNKCTWGPSYWCSNFSTVRTCGNVTKHCIERVWSKMSLPKDDNQICKICTDMVTQAREVLESNETQENLKAVFEGSCDLIPIKIVSKECDHIVDDFIPELVETLSSEMNPQVVCSVAGLCNSERIDRLLEEHKNILQDKKECGDCYKYIDILRKRIDTADSTDFRNGLFKICRRMDSFSDSCSMWVLENQDKIAKMINDNLIPQSVCMVTKQCQTFFHTHGYDLPDPRHIQVKATDDVPCEFCEQLVKQLRDMLVANTTELEFHKIMKGICQETGKFADECNNLANEYYATLYHYLVKEMKPNEACKIIGLCGGLADEPITPLIQEDRFPQLLIGQDEANSYVSEVSSAPKKENIDKELQGVQLPVERMFVTLPQSKISCSLCEYFLHYVQVEISNNKNEEAILTSASKVCTKFPTRERDECQQFVMQYGNIFIALLVQKMDPSTICPLLNLCPSEEKIDFSPVASKPSCPLCLLAVEQLIQMVKNNRSEEKIRHALLTLCTHFQPDMRSECDNFVQKYGDQLIEKLFNNHNAEEICTYLKLCEDETPREASIVQSINMYHDRPQLRADRNNYRRKPILPQEMTENVWGGDIETNEIPDNTVNGREVNLNDDTECAICKVVFQYIDQAVKDRNNKEEIKELGHDVCKHLSKNMKQKCDHFVEKYADLIMSIVADELRPEEACQQLKLCAYQPSNFRDEVLDCAVCETAASTMEKLTSAEALKERPIQLLATEVCGAMPGQYNERCSKLMGIYGESMRRKVSEVGARTFCHIVGKCAHPATRVQLTGAV